MRAVIVQALAAGVLADAITLPAAAQPKESSALLTAAQVRAVATKAATRCAGPAFEVCNVRGIPWMGRRRSRGELAAETGQFAGALAHVGQVERLNEVVTEFLDFAHPPAPAIRASDIGAAVNTAVRLSASTLALRDATIDVHVTDPLQSVEVDAEQVERALVNVLLDDVIVPRHASVRIDIAHCKQVVRGLVTSPSPAPHAGAGVIDRFEPFSESEGGNGLALAMCGRLVENQRGTIHSELQQGSMEVRYVIELPVHASAALPA